MNENNCDSILKLKVLLITVVVTVAQYNPNNIGMYIIYLFIS